MKPQPKQFILLDFDKFNLCFSSPNREEIKSVSILDILKDERLSNEDKVSLFTQKDIVTRKVARLFAVRCARSVQHLIKHKRCVETLDIIENFIIDGGKSISSNQTCQDAVHLAGIAAREVKFPTSWARLAVSYAGLDDEYEAAMFASDRAANAITYDADQTMSDETREAVLSAQVQIAIDLINEFYQVTN
jgi:hypothetical protein